MVRVTAQYKQEKGGRWLLHVEGLRNIVFDAQAEGITVTRDDDFSENVSVEYNPPLQFLTATLGPDRPIEGESKMVVRNLKTGAVRDRGTCTYRVEWVGRKQASTELGNLEVIHIRMTREIDLNLATVKITIDQLRHPKYGMVRGYTVRETKALGLIGSTTTEDMVLAKVGSDQTIETTNDAKID